jgi:hypothetical protein
VKPGESAADLSVREALREPRESALRVVNLSGPGEAPWRTWTFLGLFATLVSLIYGGSISLAVPDFSGPGSAAWLTLAAGASWPVLGVVLIVFGRVRLLVAAQVCLVTMTYGVTVLLAGAAFNSALAGLEVTRSAALIFNGAWVMLANIVMIIIHCEQLSALDMSRSKSAVLWMVGLNAPGALLGWLFLPMLTMEW